MWAISVGCGLVERTGAMVIAFVHRSHGSAMAWHEISINGPHYCCPILDYTSKALETIAYSAVYMKPYRWWKWYTGITLRSSPSKKYPHFWDPMFRWLSYRGSSVSSVRIILRRLIVLQHGKATDVGSWSQSSGRTPLCQSLLPSRHVSLASASLSSSPAIVLREESRGSPGFLSGATSIRPWSYPRASPEGSCRAPIGGT